MLLESRFKPTKFENVPCFSLYANLEKEEKKRIIIHGEHGTPVTTTLLANPGPGLGYRIEVLFPPKSNWKLSYCTWASHPEDPGKYGALTVSLLTQFGSAKILDHGDFIGHAIVVPNQDC